VNSLGQEQLFIDVANDTIRIIDPESHAVDASVPVSRIAATPLSYDTHDSESSRILKTPALMMSIPGRPPLTLASRHLAISGQQFSWSGNVHIVNVPPTYELSAADWLTLIEKFGLAAKVNDAARKG
jgi:hypothetical protein